ncbi:MAG: hypothetical protein AAF412_13780 [Pseudomonadota bacterium]
MLGDNEQANHSMPMTELSAVVAAERQVSLARHLLKNGCHADALRCLYEVLRAADTATGQEAHMLCAQVLEHQGNIASARNH